MALTIWVRNSLYVLLCAFTMLVAIVDGFSGTSVRATLSQDARKQGKTVWDGVYTVAQATRGSADYEHNCSGCHNTGEGPVLVGEAFMRRWFEDNLHILYTRMRNTMPGDSPGSLADNTYLDIVGFLLKANGFPSGAEELSLNPEGLASILIVDKGGPGGPVPNFSLVRVVGCLAQRADNAWILTNGTEPARARESGDASPADLKASESNPLGNHVFRLLDFLAPGRETYKGNKILAKGFLIRQPGDDRLNVTSLQTLGQSCAP